jgi:preprotein translocase subunit SecF
MKFEKLYDKNYKKLLLIPGILLILCIIYLTAFNMQNNGLFSRDISLTGGTTYTLFTDNSADDLNLFLSEKLSNFELKKLHDNFGEQTSIKITVEEENSDLLKSSLEEFLGERLTTSNSSVESTSSGLSEEFYNQLIIAIILAFFWMAGVVFLIFAKGIRVKSLVVFLNILMGFFLGNLFFRVSPLVYVTGFVLIAGYLIYIYIKNSIPSFAVMLSAFADIVMTLAVVDILGIKVSTAGIVAFLMLIGYSVDTDILLTTRVTRKRNVDINKELWGSFKTGTTMTITSIIAVATALTVVSGFGTILNEIFIILLIGLGFDLFNTWITNASLIKWYAESRR